MLIGTLVARRTPARLDVEAVALRGASPKLALAFTRLGRWPAIVIVGSAFAVAAFALHLSVVAVAELVALQTVSQSVAMAIKLVFRRQRPDYWYHFKERDLSYPSGHSATAIVFFLGLAIEVASTPAISRPLAGGIVAILTICIIGIPWSRLSLGAHYFTDVLGGLLFGSAWLCIAAALLGHRQGL